MQYSELQKAEVVWSYLKPDPSLTHLSCNSHIDLHRGCVWGGSSLLTVP